MNANKKICVIGGGRWGKNHIKTLYRMGNLVAIVEANEERLKELLSEFPVQGFTRVEEAITYNFDGYVLATPVVTHFPVGKMLLEKGLNVLIEKPLALSSEESSELVEVACKSEAKLMVGHVLLFHPAIIKIKKLIDGGKIGDLYYIYSNRLNLGTVRTKENVFWSLAPHDISILDFFIGKEPESIQAKGEKFLQKDVYDSTITHIEYPGNVHAHIFTSWLHPFKEHRLVVIGSKGMLSFEDSSEDKNIIFYNKRIDFNGEIPVKVEEGDEIIPYERKMPLTEELAYFIAHLDGEIKVADGRSGHEVVKVLEKVQELIDNN